MKRRSGPARRLTLAAAAGFAITVGALASPAATHAAAAAPAMRVLADTIRADANGAWRFMIELSNPTGRGLYLDSLVAEFEDAEAGARHRPRVVRSRQNAVLRSVGSLSAGDGTRIAYTGAALGERGRLAFRLFTHGGDDQRYVLESSTPVEGGVLTRLCPSIVVKLPGQDVEIVRLRSRTSRPGGAGVLIVPERGQDARTLLVRMNEFAAGGSDVVAVNLPGTGLSTGPGDLGGPRDLAAAGAALDSLLALQRGARAPIGAAGEGDGATVLALLAARRTEIGAVALVSGAYDPWAADRAAPAARRARLRAMAGPDSADWRARSALHAGGRGDVVYLVLHAESDPDAPAASARAFASALERAGARVELRIEPGTRSALGASAPDVVAEFLERARHR